MRRCLGLALTLVVLVVPAACGWDGELESGRYVTRFSNGAELLSLTVHEGAVSGSLDRAVLDGDEVETTHLAFTGTVDGEHVTLTVEHGLGVIDNLNGRMDGDNFILSMPLQTGGIREIVFRPGTAQVYNDAVGKLHRQADDIRAEQAVIAQQATLDSAVETAAQQVRDDLQRLRDLTLDDVATVQDDLQIVHDGLDQMRLYAAEVRRETDPSARCVDAGSVKADADTVQADYEALLADRDAVRSTAKMFREEIAATKANLRALDEMLAANPAYQGENLPNAKGVNRVVSSVEEEIKGGLAEADSAAEEASKLARTAAAEADSLEAKYCD